MALTRRVLQKEQGTTVREGDYVMVHVGYALQLITYEDAQVTWALLDQVVQHDA